MEFPEPVISVSLTSKSRDDVEKLSRALVRLLQRRSFAEVRVDHETGQTILSGMGELASGDRCGPSASREFQVDARVGEPEVAYRETLTKPVKRIIIGT